MIHPRQIIQQSLLIFAFLCAFPVVNAQEMWGIVTSNYAGSNGALINPCAINTSKLYMDVNVATADVFFENNYAFIHKEDYNPFKLLSSTSQWPKYGPDEMPFDHYTGKNRKYVYSSQLLKGPSCMIAYGRHAFAFHTGARVLTSAYGIPYHIANFGYYGLDYTQQQNNDFSSQNFGSSALVIGEVGLTYAYSLRKISMEDWTAGITVKRFFSGAGGYFRANDLEYIVLNDSTINIKNLNAEVGYSLPLDYDNNDFPDDGPLIKGGGFGFDIGVTFQSKDLSYQRKRISRLCSQRYIDYTYRIGVSLLDVGFVNFKQNAQLQSYNDVSKYWINIDTLNFYNLNQMRQTLSNVFYGDPDASNIDNKIRVYLPTAFSVQVDYRFTKKLYAGAVWIHPLRLGKAYIRRPAQIVLIPRYESAHLEFSLPISLYDYLYPRIGFSMRYRFLTVGTDDIFGSSGLTDFTGLDIYVSLKFNFRKGFCGRYKRNVPCENEEYGLKRPR
jgi:hypothetical protein